MANHRNSRQRRQPAILKVLAVVLVVSVGVLAAFFFLDSSDKKTSTSHSTATAKPDEPGVDYFYAKDSPYVAPKDKIKTPPSGYSMFFIENVGRHGSRSDTTDAAGKDVLKMVKKASKKNALTKLGKGLAADVDAFESAEEKVGFGHESTRGKGEWKGIGARTAANYSSFFKAVQTKNSKLSLVTTPIPRTRESMDAFEGGLTKDFPNLDLPAPEAKTDYVNFGSDLSRQGSKDLDTILNSPEVETAAANVLRGIFVPEYVDSLHGKVDKALTFYGLYATAAGMSEDTNVTFHKYFPLKDAAALAYARDAGGFYKYGPGVKGENQTYKGANVLRTAFFDALEGRINGGHTAAVFRIGHGETTMPFAALLQLPGSEKQADPGVPYTYADNPWRGANIGQMSGNVEWVAYQDSQENVLVTMRYNEKPALFRAECKPVSAGSYFYTPTELEQCLPSS